MIAAKWVKAGTVIHVLASGSPGLYEIVGVKDGRVVLKMHKPSARLRKGKWWLDYSYVRENATRVRTIA
jgi:hypothetical protein